MKNLLSAIPLVDQHCHSLAAGSGQHDAETLLRITSEAPAGYPKSDLKERLVWHAIKKVVSRYTGCQALTDEELTSVLQKPDYKEYCRSIFSTAGYKELFVDTGYAPVSAPSLEELAELTGTQTYPILRLERLAEKEFERELSFSEWWDTVHNQVKQARQTGYIGAKSIIAYRSGLHLHPVELEDAKQSYEIWKLSGSNRLTEDMLLNFLVWESAKTLAEQSLPLQFHTGYGDPDTNLQFGNPLLLRAFIESYTSLGLPIVLLHTYPYHREAGYLASVYDNVYFDTSLIVPLGLSGSRRVVAEALELTPYSRYLFASDAHTRPEMFALAAELFRDAFQNHLEDPLVTRYTSAETREKWAKMVFHSNSRRLYFGEM